MKTSELIGTALDWAVAKAKETGMFPVGYWTDMVQRGTFNPSTKWEHGGPIIEHTGMIVGLWDEWEAKLYLTDEDYTVIVQTGPTPLVAAMRCYVANELGNEIQTPEELK